MTHPKTVHEFLNQQEWWINKGGWVAIANMDQEFRRRAASILLRRGRFFLIWELDEIMLEEGQTEVQEFMGRVAAPGNFIRRAPLYKRLIEGGADPQAFRGYDDD